MNMIEATLETANGGLAAKIGSQTVDLGDGVLSNRPALKEYEGKKVVIGIRPEHLEDASPRPTCSRRASAARRSGVDRGARPELIVYLKSDAAPAQTEEVKEPARDGGLLSLRPSR